MASGTAPRVLISAPRSKMGKAAAEAILSFGVDPSGLREDGNLERQVKRAFQRRYNVGARQWVKWRKTAHGRALIRRVRGEA